MLNVIIDYSWLVNKYFYAYKDKGLSVNLSGVVFNTGVLYGVTNIISSIYLNTKPVNIYICMDGGSCERKELNEEYKKDRKDKQDVFYHAQDLPSILTLMDGVRFYHQVGKEADDLIASLVFSLYRNGISSSEIVVFSSDNDFLQLMPYALISKNFTKGKFEFVMQKYLDEKFSGITPNMILYFRSIVGDKSDNIVGIKGIRKEKAKIIASALYSSEGCVEKALDFIKDDSCRKLLSDNSDIIKSNIVIMDLCKYKDKSIVGVEDYLKVQPVVSFLDKYRLNVFKRFLQSNFNI